MAPKLWLTQEMAHLVRVFLLGAVITGVPNTVPVAVPLVRVGHPGTVVGYISDSWGKSGI